jgi:acetyl esterase/lipase
VQARLFSWNTIKHQIKNLEKAEFHPAGQDPAAGLMIHFHGGGFVAQSSQSHEVLHWAIHCAAIAQPVDSPQTQVGRPFAAAHADVPAPMGSGA